MYFSLARAAHSRVAAFSVMFFLWKFHVTSVIPTQAEDQEQPSGQLSFTVLNKSTQRAQTSAKGAQFLDYHQNPP